MPIKIPSNKDLSSLRVIDVNKDYDVEVLSQATTTAYDIPDRYMSTADTDKALRDLVAGVYTQEDQEYTIEDATVPGFREGVKLLPHQITGRRWMADRESEKKTGGILADDMGLGKTIQTITRIVEGRPTKKDKQDGWAASTLLVHRAFIDVHRLIMHTAESYVLLLLCPNGQAKSRRWLKG